MIDERDPVPQAVHNEPGADCTVRCRVCHLEVRVSFAARLRGRWPACCPHERLGGTMELVTEVPLDVVAAAVDGILPPPAVRCTEVSAAWCPIHGTCKCPDREVAMEDPACPLHAPESSHAEPPGMAVAKAVRR